jgi:hypothetical protein
MGVKLNVRRVVTEEFKREFRRLNGPEREDKLFSVLKKQFDLKEVQLKVDATMEENSEEAIRKYHRNNLRYLAKYYAVTLHNQLKSSEVTLSTGVRDKTLLKHALKVFKSNPQCQVYH